ncbi:MAG: sensor histidine kinase [Thermoplasmata archaeon]
MDVIFLGDEAHTIRYPGSEEGDGTIEFITPSLSDDLDEVVDDDFDVMIVELDGFKTEDRAIDILTKEKEGSPLIFFISKENTGDTSGEADHSLKEDETLKETLVIAKKIIDDGENSQEERKEMLKSLLRHDLMNKIRLMKGSLQILRSEHDLPEDAEKRLQAIEKRIDHSVELIESISNHWDNISEKVKAVDPISSLEEVLASMEDCLEEEGFDVTLEIKGDNTVMGGPLLKEAYSNIIENAVKHSGGEKIRISIRQTDDGVIVSIEDDGKGIEEDKQKMVFEKGFTMNGEESTGLGLYLVEKVMESYEGRVKLKDSELGGARFDLQLRKV